MTLDSIEQQVIVTTDRNKEPLLLRLLETENPYLAVVFCRTKLRAKKLTEALQEAGVPADELHGDLTQAKRETVMKRFRSAKIQVLIATDVAARGLDVEGVTHVFNYDAPADGDTYIHRIGRTGRAGESGKAITLATPRDRTSLEAIEQKIRTQLKRIHGSEYGIGLSAGAEQHERIAPPAPADGPNHQAAVAVKLDQQAVAVAGLDQPVPEVVRATSLLAAGQQRTVADPVRISRQREARPSRPDLELE